MEQRPHRVLADILEALNLKALPAIMHACMSAQLAPFQLLHSV